MLWLISTDAPGAVFLSPFIFGALLAVPIAVLTAWPALGAWLARIGLWRIPEEVDTPALIQSLGLPVVGRKRASVLASDQVAADSIGVD